MRFLGRRRKETPLQDDVVSILSTRADGGEVKLTVKLEGKTWEELSSFMKEHAFFKVGDVLSQLFAYGVTEREGIDVESRRMEMMALGTKYAALKFQAYTLFNDNRAITMALSIRLRENKNLRKKAEDSGLISPRREPWDDWSSGDLDYFYKRYLHGR